MRNIILILTATILLSGCAANKKFSTPEISDTNLLGDQPLSDVSEVEIPAWSDYFTDSNLQSLIQKALDANSDIQIAKSNIEQSEQLLRTSKLAYVPSLAFTPDATISSFDSYTAKTYSLPLVTSWEIDVFGRIRNSKEQAVSMYMQSEEYLRMIELQIITAVANSYYTLIMLDEQIAIAKDFVSIGEQNLEMMISLRDAGMQSDIAVNQTRATLYETKATLKELELQVSLTENAVALLINETPQTIKRSSIASSSIFIENLNDGISLEKLAARPDVKVAEYALRANFYGVKVARSAMYPSITLSASAGWTNYFSTIVNPGQLLLSAIGSLTAPIFNKGVNRANLNIAKEQYESALVTFQKSLLTAGNEVNGLLTEQERLNEKLELRKSQIVANNKAYEQSIILMEYSSSTYLDVLIAQSSLLQTRLVASAEWLQLTQSYINLYKSLGGNF